MVSPYTSISSKEGFPNINYVSPVSFVFRKKGRKTMDTSKKEEIQAQHLASFLFLFLFFFEKRKMVP
jgi:hypothetical protein